MEIHERERLIRLGVGLFFVSYVLWNIGDSYWILALFCSLGLFILVFYIFRIDFENSTEGGSWGNKLERALYAFLREKEFKSVSKVKNAHLYKLYEKQFYNGNVVIEFQKGSVKVYHQDDPNPELPNAFLMKHRKTRSNRIMPLENTHDLETLKVHIQNMLMFSGVKDRIPVPFAEVKKVEKGLWRKWLREKAVTVVALTVIVIGLPAWNYATQLKEKQYSPVTIPAEEEDSLTSPSNNESDNVEPPSTPSYADSGCGSGTREGSLAYSMCVKEAIRTACGQYMGWHMENGVIVNRNQPKDPSALQQCIDENISPENRGYNPY